jgi:predicted acetyltransferase
MVSLLGLLRGLRDQYSVARVTLPIDLPVNWLLSERQVPHRRVDHSSATCRTITRMQLRVLDPIKFLDGQRVVSTGGGKAVITVRTVDGVMQVFELAVEDGHVSAKASSASADVECDEVVFAALCTGALPAATAAALRLIRLERPEALPALAALGDGPRPFCYEYF